jgi:hypothetical protein
MFFLNACLLLLGDLNCYTEEICNTIQSLSHNGDDKEQVEVSGVCGSGSRQPLRGHF